MDKIISLLTLILISGSLHAQTPSESARKTAQEFYVWVLTHPTVSLPSTTQMQALSPLLSKNLASLIERARVLEAQCIKHTPADEKPPVFEGSLLVGNDEGASEILMGETKIRHSDALIQSQLFSIDRRFPKAHPNRVYSWSDTLKLTNTQGRWVLSDILRQNKFSLITELKNYLKEHRHCADTK